MKAGMISEFDNNGHRNEITVLALENCQVVQVNQQKGSRHITLQVGSGDVEKKSRTKPLQGHFEKAGVPLSTQEPAASYKIVAWNDVGRRKNDRTVRIRRNDVYESPE